MAALHAAAQLLAWRQGCYVAYMMHTILVGPVHGAENCSGFACTGSTSTSTY